MNLHFTLCLQHRDFVIINKPAGISVHKDQQAVGFTELVAKQLGVEQVWLVHRLDKITSGLLILALNKEAATNNTKSKKPIGQLATKSRKRNRVKLWAICKNQEMGCGNFAIARKILRLRNLARILLNHHFAILFCNPKQAKRTNYALQWKVWAVRF